MTKHARVPSRSLSILITACLLSGAAWATTPDGATPAEESVCDVLHDATPGLYGLCTAYCEAQDCDSVEQAVSGQCRAPSPALLDIFERRRRADDPAMPCLAAPPPPCPCFDLDDLAAMDLQRCEVFDFGFDVVAISDAEQQDGAVSERGAGWGVCTLVSEGAVVLEIDEEEAFACEILIRHHAEESGIVCE